MRSEDMRTLTLFSGILLVLAACDSATGPGSRDLVEVRFQVAGVGPMTATGAGPAYSPASPEGISAFGSNGTLELDGVWMIVAEFELESEDQEDDQPCPGMDGDDCHEFEAPPFFADLPLNDGHISVATDGVPAGVYEEFEFEVEDLNDDDEDDGRGASELLSRIRASFPNWPAEASVRITGSFTPDGGAPRAFEVYVDAEIEVERSLNPALVIVDGASPGAEAIVVEIDPRAWFQRSDGRDLSEYDFSQTGTLLDFEVELEDGFMQIEVEDVG
jgi:hypothetical protein